MCVCGGVCVTYGRPAGHWAKALNCGWWSSGAVCECLQMQKAKAKGKGEREISDPRSAILRSEFTVTQKRHEGRAGCSRPRVVFCVFRVRFTDLHQSPSYVGRSLAMVAAVGHGPPLQTAHAQSKFCIISGKSKVGGPMTYKERSVSTALVAPSLVWLSQTHNT